jgi:hypothetical protein
MSLDESLSLLYVLYRIFNYEILAKIFGYSTEYPCIEVGPPLPTYPVSLLGLKTERKQALSF